MTSSLKIKGVKLFSTDPAANCPAGRLARAAIGPKQLSRYVLARVHCARFQGSAAIKASTALVARWHAVDRILINHHSVSIALVVFSGGNKRNLMHLCMVLSHSRPTSKVQTASRTREEFINHSGFQSMRFGLHTIQRTCAEVACQQSGSSTCLRCLSHCATSI